MRLNRKEKELYTTKWTTFLKDNMLYERYHNSGIHQGGLVRHKPPTMGDKDYEKFVDASTLAGNDLIGYRDRTTTSTIDARLATAGTAYTGAAYTDPANKRRHNANIRRKLTRERKRRRKSKTDTQNPTSNPTPKDST